MPPSPRGSLSMSDHRVALTRCADYDPAQVEAALRRSVDLLGGIGAFVHPGQRVLLKPNLLRALPPERAATTHPSVVAAMARIVIEVGGKPLILDSPGGPYSVAPLRFVYKRSGMILAAEQSGAELNYDVGAAQVSHPQGQVMKRLDLVKPVTECDAVINLAKFKTHNLTTLTLAIKNLFGLVPGVLKIGYHSTMRDPERFCDGLLDIYTYVRPVLNVIDAIVGMEGNGPSGGDPRPMGIILAAPDALAADVVGAALVGLDPLAVGTTAAAQRRGLITGGMDAIELLGDPLDSVRVSDFRLGTAAEIDPGLVPKALVPFIRTREDANGTHHRSVVRAIASGWLGRQFVVVPRAASTCIGCGYCAKHCPVNAITIVRGKARMDPDKCIRCYCCHELCPELAVDLHRPWLGRMLLGA